MRKRRLFFEQALKPQSTIELGGRKAHYLINVLRLKPGDMAYLFDNSGLEFPCTVQHVAAGTIEVDVGQGYDPGSESPLQSWLIQAVAKGERMDYCVQKATELGISKIVPVFTHRTIVKLDKRRAQSRQQHWQKIAHSASEQSGRVTSPVIAQPCSLGDFLDRDLPSKTTKVVLHANRKPTRTEIPLHPIDQPLVLFAGPEGGFDESEIKVLLSLDAHCVTLGPRTLRSETAGLVALVYYQALWGDL